MKLAISIVTTWQIYINIHNNKNTRFDTTAKTKEYKI